MILEKFRKYQVERARLKEEINTLKSNAEEQTNEELKLLPHLFRTPYLNPAFAHALLTMKEK